MKAILKLKNKKLYLDWNFGYDKIPKYIKATKSTYSALKIINALNTNCL